MKIEKSDAHDSCVATYQTLEADQLNRALKEGGVSDPAKRREIIERFLFDAGYFRDACWFEECGRRFRPVVCFQQVDLDGTIMDVILVPDPEFGTAYHEYAHGAAAWLFEHSESVSEIVCGDLHINE